MELAALEQLIVLLRKHGVTKYVDDQAAVSLELGEAPRAEPAVDLRREGFRPDSNGRSAAVNDILDRLGPSYSDPSLFEIK